MLSARKAVKAPGPRQARFPLRTATSAATETPQGKATWRGCNSGMVAPPLLSSQGWTRPEPGAGQESAEPAAPRTRQQRPWWGSTASLCSLSSFFAQAFCGSVFLGDAHFRRPAEATSPGPQPAWSWRSASWQRGTQASLAPAPSARLALLRHVHTQQGPLRLDALSSLRLFQRESAVSHKLILLQTMPFRQPGSCPPWHAVTSPCGTRSQTYSHAH